MSLMYVSFIVNSEDSELVGVFSSLTEAVRKTFEFLVKNEYLDWYENEKNFENSENISDDMFLAFLKLETENWHYTKMHEVCKKYNSSYDMENFFVCIKGTEVNL